MGKLKLILIAATLYAAYYLAIRIPQKIIIYAGIIGITITGTYILLKKINEHQNL